MLRNDPAFSTYFFITENLNKQDKITLVNSFKIPYYYLLLNINNIYSYCRGALTFVDRKQVIKV
jgi:hypothetical protein